MELVDVKTHLQKQLNIFIKNNHEHQIELGNFYHKEQNYTSEINNLQAER